MSDSGFCSTARGLLEELRPIKQAFDLAYNQAISTQNASDIAQTQELKQAFILKASQIEKILVIHKLIRREQEANHRFFGKEYSITQFPKEITLKQIDRWKEQGYELKYLPAISLAQITADAGVITDVKPREDIPGWTKKPNDWFFEQIKLQGLPKDAATLKGGWILVDIRPKPTYTDGTQMYQDDPLAPALAELNQKGIITQLSYNRGTPLSSESRFGLSPNELAKSEVKQAFANVLGLTPDQVSLQPALVCNILGNRDHPEWGETNTSEWFADETVGSQRLCGGSSGCGGLSCVDSVDLDSRDDYIGFRLLGRFSS